jgi:N-acetylneuraminate synthase
MSIYIIAEIGINHNGDMSLAKELINKAKNANCNAVKFQKRDIESVYTKEELDVNRESKWGTTNREQKTGLEFSIEQYKELQSYTKSVGIDFGMSCWDVKSVSLVDKELNVNFQKVASALLTDKDFLHILRKTGKPVIISTGMSNAAEVSAAVEILDGSLTYILACTSTYPSKAEEINLRYIDALKVKYPHVKIGFSNHYNGHDACVAAVARDAKCIEFHITKDRSMYGSDQSASIENVKGLVSAIRTTEKMIGTDVKEVLESEKPILKKLRKISNTI